ncbi:hypothetical protein E5676_scaffold639G00110 [Cucumis melo var. makuwa]|uniref:Uncharacterized protein n=1 Tax=Cucumis melo var. makuwa TaxID=1194695 RepID=A0A5A7V3A5_CUCMM|nr:hypothetical protein E6C27_scaffold22G00140 [Cucumis melo var. makuwa]TYJ97615.1 hypothetical protein E5676_scaffold639G00110 [Cucumis melo var. makuwa]
MNLPCRKPSLPSSVHRRPTRAGSRADTPPPSVVLQPNAAIVKLRRSPRSPSPIPPTAPSESFVGPTPPAARIWKPVHHASFTRESDPTASPLQPEQPASASSRTHSACVRAEQCCASVGAEPHRISFLPAEPPNPFEPPSFFQSFAPILEHLGPVDFEALDFFSKGSSVATQESYLHGCPSVITTYLELCSPTGPSVWHEYRYDSSDLMGSSQPDCLSVSSGFATDQYVLGAPLGHRRPDSVPTGAHVARVRERASYWVATGVRARASWWAIRSDHGEP